MPSRSTRPRRPMSQSARSPARRYSRMTAVPPVEEAAEEELVSK